MDFGSESTSMTGAMMERTFQKKDSDEEVAMIGNLRKGWVNGGIILK